VRFPFGNYRYVYKKFVLREVQLATGRGEEGGSAAFTAQNSVATSVLQHESSAC
jgi:hypothetical protein